jgi:hypothetical protein
VAACYILLGGERGSDERKFETKEGERAGYT